MWAELIGVARAKGRPVIRSGTHIANTVARSAMARQGRIEVGVVVRFEVPPAGA